MTLLPAKLLILLRLIEAASSQPAISFPFNSQLPPAARIDEPFSYTLAPYTFTSTSPNISYSLGNHPDWLSFDADERRLHGMPTDADVPPGDVVGQPVDIVAKDDTGETTMRATLVVARDPPPKVEIPMSKQIDSFGKFSAPSSIISYPSAVFKFSFHPKTFGDRDLNYYATSADGSPLPAWIHFDGPSMTFSGRTPPFKSLVQPPQAFDVKLVASDIVGFAATSLTFSIVVGSHQLTADHPIISLNARRGSELSYNGLQNGIRIDGQPVAPGDLSVTTDRLPKWLSYDPNTFRLRGTPGKRDHSTNLTISFHDPFANTLDVLVEMHIASRLFESTPGDIKLQPGTLFEFDLAKHFRNPEDLEIKVTTSPHQDWLKADGLKMSGIVPRLAKGEFETQVDARSRRSGIKETEAFKASFLSLDVTTAVAKKPKSPTPTQTSESQAATADPETQVGRLSTGEILLATIIPIIFITILLMLLICYVRRRGARRTYLSSRYRNNMINPMAASLAANSSGSSTQEMERVGGAMLVGAHSFKPAPLAHLEAISHFSRGESSDTLGRLSDAEAPRRLLPYDATTTTLRSIDDSSDSSDDNRQSWITVEGDEAAMGRGGYGLARKSHRTDTTIPELTHDLFPTPGLFYEARKGDFRSGLDVRIPRFEPAPGTQGSASAMYRPYGPGLGAHFNMTSSSVALPVALEHDYRWHAGNDESLSNWETIAESERGDSVSEVRRPEQALLDHGAHDSRNWSYAESTTGNKSLGTNMSFESSENWRVIGGPRSVAAHQLYKDLVAESPFHPSRPGTGRDGARPGERESAERLSPSEWRDEVTATAGAGPDTDVTMSGGRGDEGASGQLSSDGSGSFKVFL